MTLQTVPIGDEMSKPDLGPFGLGLCLNHFIPNPNLLLHCHVILIKSEPFNLNQTAPVSPKAF